MPLIYHEGYSLGDGAENNQLLKDTVGWTGKNLLKNTATSQTINGVTFTVNADGSVTANGTATATAFLPIVPNDTVTIKKGSYILSAGDGIIGNYRNYGLYINNVTLGTFASTETEESTHFTLSEDILAHECRIFVVSGATVSNLTFYPMLRRADILDDTYEPYHESVETMYEEEIHGVNLLEVTASTQTINGVTFTVNSDGTIKVNGTATADANFFLNPSMSYTTERSLVMTGCPDNSVGQAKITLRINSNGTQYYLTSDKEVVVPVGLIENPRIIIANGTTVNNLVFKPMIRKADIEDSTYRPYNPQAIQNQLNAQGVLGAKNLLDVTANTQTINGVTFTVNRDSDGNVINVTVNGTPSSDIYFRINSKFSEVGRYILNGILGGSNTFRMQAYIYASSGDTFKRSYTDTGSGTEVVIDNGEYANFEIIVTQSGGAVSNKKVYPMLRLASDPDDTYQPYAMTNRELTEKKINIADLKTVVSASSDFTDFKTRIASL